MDQLRAEKEALLADRSGVEGLLVGPTPSSQLSSRQVPATPAGTFPPAGKALQPLALPSAQRQHLTEEQEGDSTIRPQQQREARKPPLFLNGCPPAQPAPQPGVAAVVRGLESTRSG